MILIKYNKIKRRNSALLNHWKKGGSKIFDIDNKIKRRNSASKTLLEQIVFQYFRKIRNYEMYCYDLFKTDVFELTRAIIKMILIFFFPMLQSS